MWVQAPPTEHCNVLLSQLLSLSAPPLPILHLLLMLPPLPSSPTLSWSTVGSFLSHVRAPSLAGRSKVLPGQWQQFTFQNVRDVTLAVQFHSWGHKNEGRPSRGCDGRPHYNRGWILATTHSPAFHGCIPTPNTVVLMADALFNVKFLLVREHQIGQHAIFHEVQKVSTSFDPHSFMRGCKLMALLHLVGEGLEVLVKDAAHRSLADSSFFGQFGHWTTEICPQLFPCAFNHSLGSKCFLSALARSIGYLACLPEFLDHFPNRFTPNLKLFCDGRIALTLFMEACDCFSVYSNRSNVIYII